MNANAPLGSISVAGDPLMARVVAALLSRTLAPHNCRVTLGELDDPHSDGTGCLISPDIAKSLADIGLTPIRLLDVGASVHFSWMLRGKEIMSGPFGVPKGGIEFHHHLHRVEGALTYEKLVAFNPGAVIGKRWPAEEVVKRNPARYGMKISRTALQQLLMGRTGNANGSAADFRFDVRGGGAAKWNDNRITVPASSSFPELGLHRCVRAVERFFALLPGLDDSAPEQSEFNRLSAAEEERFQDFAALLVGDMKRPALQRKIAVFSACGRIPEEDYELFPPGQWMCALLQSGIKPRDYNRMADRIPVGETQQWLDSLRGQLDQLAKAGAA